MVFAPVINQASWREERLLFKAFEPNVTPMKKNAFGIPEPLHKPGTSVRGTTLDLVCVPLVAFNRQCDRIGMGGGYYDCAFASRGVKPVTLVGLAFDCQQADFEAHVHDVPMDAIVTETTVHTRAFT